MEFDDDILPLMQKMDTVLDRMQMELFPLFATLNEDVLVTNYSVDEQARISLATAFTLVLLTYAHDRLQRKTRTTAADQQVQLKMERVADYIKKLRQITDLEQQQQQVSKPKHEAIPSTGGKKRLKRAREETCAPEQEDADSGDALHVAAPEDCVDDTSLDPYGDAILFKEVERGAGKTALLVQNLLQHVKDAKNAHNS